MGRIVHWLVVIFLAMDGVMKVVRPAVVIETTTKLGYPETKILPLGLVLLGSTGLYVLHRTSFLGAILLTGYLGGAVATHVRVGTDVFPIVFPIIIGCLIWLGLYLRDSRLRGLLFRGLD